MYKRMSYDVYLFYIYRINTWLEFCIDITDFIEKGINLTTSLSFLNSQLDLKFLDYMKKRFKDVFQVMNGFNKVLSNE